MVRGNNTEDKCLGLTANTFKERFGGHKANPGDRTKSTLAGHIWSLKDQNKEQELELEVVCRAPQFSPTTVVCNLCTSKQWHNLFKLENATFNRRKELSNHCRHKERLLIVKNTRRLRKNGSWPRLTLGPNYSLWLYLLLICLLYLVV